ncbi:MULTISPECIES: DnaJ domain-containing protein [Prochlorococcus]|uniref:DnaJ domain-containing protein n=1 Tax=Prochlorococcus TaxID=1218 RepID=UPI0005336EA1|nr:MULTISPECIES: DnaJ domain-containing protein [Prochlorococcus]KGG12477.1 DnaJ-class molecular chaperone CbpA [Prochlorococcus sp. MIT 0601]
MTSTTKPDYWSILGISPGSDLIQIKTAFRKEARRWHPDLNVNDVNAEDRFKLVNEAYAVLSDPKKRASWESSNISFKASDDIFSNGFPTYDEYIKIVLGIEIENDPYNKYQSKETEPDNNFENELEDEFEDELEDELEDDLYNNSSQYDQSNFVPAKSPKPSPPVRKATEIETLVELSPEEALLGSSIQIELVDGTLVEVNTPPFAGDGWRLRLSGVVIGGEDHFLQLRVQTEDNLRIDGLRVFYKLELFPQDALFGCAIEVPTLNGPVTLQVPPNSSSGRLLRLRGRGLQYEELCGDQIVEIIVVIPEDLSEAELALYRRLQELSFDRFKA